MGFDDRKHPADCRSLLGTTVSIHPKLGNAVINSRPTRSRWCCYTSNRFTGNSTPAGRQPCHWGVRARFRGRRRPGARPPRPD